jgi:GH24 family phage-related lysozyme (muramidase)
MKDLAGALTMLKGYEGNLAYMYLDSRGFVTVGVGFLLRTAQDATLFTFWKNPPAVSEKATGDEIKREWTAINGKPHPHLAAYYKPFTTLAMSQPDIDTVLTKNIDKFEGKARQVFVEWDKFPSAAQLALLDMIYNLGSLDAFPMLVGSARKKDWATCANECHRSGPGQQRNDDTKNRFVAAAKEQALVTAHSAGAQQALPNPITRKPLP